MQFFLQDYLQCISCKKSFIFSAGLARCVHDLVQDLASLAKKYLQDLHISCKTVLRGYMTDTSPTSPMWWPFLTGCHHSINKDFDKDFMLLCMQLEKLLRYYNFHFLTHTNSNQNDIRLLLIAGNWNSRKTETGAGTEHGNGNLHNCCYSSDSSPVRFTELHKPSE